MSGKTKIIIDATSRMLYASFYIQGLYDVFGKKNISFSGAHFNDLERHAEAFAFEHYFAFILLQPDGHITKIVVDYCDPTDINENAYNWSDFYAKINFNPNETPDEFLDKIIVIPPGFGIKIWNKWETVYHCFTNLIRCRLTPIVPCKKFFKDYYAQYKRPSLPDYKNIDKPIVNKERYVFMIATLWQGNGEKTNRQRRTFIETVRAKKSHFEGGFLATENHPKRGEYKDFLITETYTSKMYLAKTKQSNFVFNTPAVHNCHGWKLAEYLAMGKAIISMPLSNKLPVNLEHGKNIYIVNNKTELDAAVTLFLNDNSYRNKLSQNAEIYYETVVSPQMVIQTILSRIPARIGIPK